LARISRIPGGVPAQRSQWRDMVDVVVRWERLVGVGLRKRKAFGGGIRGAATMACESEKTVAMTD